MIEVSFIPLVAVRQQARGQEPLGQTKGIGPPTGLDVREEASVPAGRPARKEWEQGSACGRNKVMRAPVSHGVDKGGVCDTVISSSKGKGRQAETRRKEG